MKVFISWSGNTSHKIAAALRDWLPFVIQSIKPYVSSEDIDKGVRWWTDIASELEQCSFGILCVTRDNVESPWLNFEAGALSKIIEKSRVCPLLFRIKPSEVQGPLVQFQSTVYEKEDILKLVRSLNSSSQGEAIDDSRLEQVFGVWWPKLEENLDKIGIEEESSREAPETSTPPSPTEAVLEEILELTRSNQRLLGSQMIEKLGGIESGLLELLASVRAIQYRGFTESVKHYLADKYLKQMEEMQSGSEAPIDFGRFREIGERLDEVFRSSSSSSSGRSSSSSSKGSSSPRA